MDNGSWPNFWRSLIYSEFVFQSTKQSFSLQKDVQQNSPSFWSINCVTNFEVINTFLVVVPGLFSCFKQSTVITCYIINANEWMI